MNQQTIVDVLKSGQIVAWQDHEEGADTYVSIITWNASLTLNLWQSLAGDGSFHNLDCKTLNDVGLSAFTLKQAYATGAAQKWLEEIQAEEEEELNSVPLGLDQEGEKFVDRRLFPGIDDNAPTLTDADLDRIAADRVADEQIVKDEEQDEYGGEVPNIPNAMMHSAHGYEETQDEIDRRMAESDEEVDAQADALERLPVLPDLEPPPTVRLRPQDWTEPNHPTD